MLGNCEKVIVLLIMDPSGKSGMGKVSGVLLNCCSAVRVYNWSYRVQCLSDIACCVFLADGDGVSRFVL